MRRLSAVCAGLTVLSLGQLPSLAEFVYVSQNRYVSAGPQTYETTDLGPFTVDIFENAYASINSNLEASRVTARLDASSGGAYIWSYASSGLAATFDLAQPAEYVITGRGTRDYYGGTWADWSFSLQRSNGETVYSTAAATHSGDFGATGILAPGRYTLASYASASSNGFDFGSGGGSLTFSMSLTPEPTILAMLGLGLPLLRRRA